MEGYNTRSKASNNSRHTKTKENTADLVHSSTKAKKLRSDSTSPYKRTKSGESGIPLIKTNIMLSQNNNNKTKPVQTSFYNNVIEMESDDNNQCTTYDNDDHSNTTQARNSMHITVTQNSTTDQLGSTDHHNNETEFVENRSTATVLDSDQMEIEDNTQQQDGNTIVDQTTATQATYSQIAQKNLVHQNSIQSTKQNDFTEEWIQEINKKLEQDVLETFDKSVWNYDKIVAALKTTEGIQEFIKYKMQTKPTN
jgi:hypothetical protein